MVDEYPDDGTIYRLRRKSSRRPLTLEQVIEMFETVERLFDGETDVGGSPARIREHYLSYEESSATALEGVRDFTHVSSLFYPELEAWYEAEAEEWYRAKLEELGGLEPEPGPLLWQFRWPPQSALRRLAITDFRPDDVLQISDPPMTEHDALQIVERLRREGRMPSFAEIEVAIEEIVARLSDEED